MARYSAYLSYSHHDTRRARALQRSLETYRLPRRLRSNANELAFRNGRLKPVFRDRDELAAAPDLSATIGRAIADSYALIVVATPASARSAWVGQEISLFRTLHGPDRVFAALFTRGGEAFHEALRSTTSDGTSVEPLAADFHEQGDGKRLALLKLVAVLAGVPLDALIRRDAQRRTRALALSVLGGVILAAVIGALTVLALISRGQADTERMRGSEIVARLVQDRDALAKAGRLELLQAHDRAALRFFEGRNTAALPASTRLLAAKLLHGISEDDEAAGDLSSLRGAASEAWGITARLISEAPQEPSRILAHAQSEYWEGLAAWRGNDTGSAERHFRAYAVLASRLVALNPLRADWQDEAGEAESNLATFVLQAKGDFGRAASLFSHAQRRFETAAALMPGVRKVEDDLADGYGWLADVQRVSGNLPAARAHRLEQRRVLLGMQARDAGDARVGAALIKNQLGLARIAALEGDWEAAITEFDSGRTAALGRVAVDRVNADIARQARAFDLFEVHTWLSMPPKKRPPLARVAQVLDGCRADRGKLGTAEAETFCTLLQARLAAAEGRGKAAAALLARIPASSPPASLSQRWRIDLSAEREKAQTDVSRFESR